MAVVQPVYLARHLSGAVHILVFASFHGVRTSCVCVCVCVDLCVLCLLAHACAGMHSHMHLCHIFVCVCVCACGLRHAMRTVVYSFKKYTSACWTLPRGPRREISSIDHYSALAEALGHKQAVTGIGNTFGT